MSYLQIEHRKELREVMGRSAFIPIHTILKHALYRQQHLSYTHACQNAASRFSYLLKILIFQTVVAINNV